MYKDICEQQQIHRNAEPHHSGLLWQKPRKWLPECTFAGAALLLTIWSLPNVGDEPVLDLLLVCGVLGTRQDVFLGKLLLRDM